MMSPLSLQLLQAAHDHRWDESLALVPLAEHLHERLPNGWTALTYALRHAQRPEAEAVVLAMLEREPGLVGSEPPTRDSMLMQACVGGNTRVVQQMLTLGVGNPGFALNHRTRLRPNGQGGYVLGCNALMQAAKHNHVEVVKLLLAQPGIAPKDVDHAHLDPLMFAVSQGFTDIVRCLIPVSNLHRIHRTGTDMPFNTLIVAAQAGHLETVNVLLDAGADPWIDQHGVNGPYRTSVLHALARHYNAPFGLDRMVQRLVHVVDPLSRDHMDNTPLMIAAKHHHTAAIDPLVAVSGDWAQHRWNDQHQSLLLQAWNGTVEEGLTVDRAQTLDALSCHANPEDIRRLIHDTGLSREGVIHHLPRWWVQEEARLLQRQVDGATPMAATTERPRL